MHILLVTSYFEPDQGAAAIILTRLARKLVARGHRVTVLTSLPHYPQGRIADGYRGAWQVIDQRGGLTVIQTWLWATPSPKISRKFISQISFALTGALRGLGLPRPDVMLIEAQPIFTHLMGSALARLRGIPYVLDVHDLWPDHLLSVGAVSETHPAYRTARALVDSSLRAARGIICLTPGLTEKIREYARDAEKVQTVFSGIDLERFQPGKHDAAFRQAHDLGTHKLIAYIGTLGTAYDFETMLDAAQHLTDREDVLFLFIGTGTQQAYMQQRMQQGGLSNVRRVDWVDYEVVPSAWAATYATFWALHDHPLHRRALGTKLYEAFGSGVPVVAALDGVVANILQDSDGGIAVPPGDSVALAAALRDLLDHPARRDAMGHAARRYAEQHFDADRAADRYEAMLMRAIRA